VRALEGKPPGVAYLSHPQPSYCAETMLFSKWYFFQRTLDTVAPVEINTFANRSSNELPSVQQAAKKRGIVDYKGELLLQGMSDNVMIILKKDSL
jgi:hypothetical protein